VFKLLQQYFSRHKSTPKALQRLLQMPKLVYGLFYPREHAMLARVYILLFVVVVVVVVVVDALLNSSPQMS
jgi:hypothetical protein